MFPCSFKPATTAIAGKTLTVLTKSQRNYKVMVAGAAGGVGQPLALLLKMNPLVSRLAMFDVTATTPGISEDVSHIDTMALVTCHTGTNELVSALKGADVVVHAPYMSRKTGSNAFQFNACVARDLASSIAQIAPKAMTVIISNLMNTLVPIVSEVMLKAGVYDPGRVFGVTTLDSVRASVFVAQTFGMDPRTVSVPVIGGGTTNTIVPVFSQCKPSIKFRDLEQIKALTIRVREASDKMMIAKAGTASATLSMGYAAARMVDSILRGLKGQGNVVECAYVRSDVTDLKYFSNPLLLGRSGIVKNLGIGNLTEFEQQLMKNAVPDLHQNIKKGCVSPARNNRKIFSRSLESLAAYTTTRKFSTCSVTRFKVCVVGASGGIGQPLCLLLKRNRLVTKLALYDIAPVTPGVAVDLSHMNTPAKVSGHKDAGEMNDAIRDSDVVVVLAGLARKPGMTRDDLFNTNASVITETAQCVASNAPQAVIAIVTNPVNSMVPVACEVLKKACAFDPARVLGVTTLDVVRAASFVAEINCIDPECVSVPVIGGHAGITIIPLLSQSQPPVNLTDQKEIETLTKKIQEAGTAVVKAKAGDGSATLSTAYATARITNAILRGLRGDPNVVECAYVESNVTELAYFANPVMFGPCGIAQNLGYGVLNGYEQQQLKTAIPALLKNIKTGVTFVNKC